MKEWKLPNGTTGHVLTPEERQKGLEKRRANATKRKMEKNRLEVMLSQEIEDKEIRDKLEDIGLKPNILSLMIERQIENALAGNLKSCKFLCDLLSEEDIKRIISASR